jgi:hypothetical protein
MIEDPNWSLLRAKLRSRSFAPNAVVDDRYIQPRRLAEMLKDGRFYRVSARSRSVSGEPHECFSNAIRYVQAHPEFHICAGFGLFVDGRWYQHAWVMEPRRFHAIDVTSNWFKLLYGIVT